MKTANTDYSQKNRYCPRCGFRVDDFNFCPACGSNLRAKRKNPWIAGILNFLFLGGGYLYIGKKTGFGIGLVLVFLLSMMGAMETKSINAYFLAADTLLSIVLAWDAYEMAGNL
ncbi:MAG: hypothetical protein ACXQTD_01350 [Candidatus Syntropharchaeia archaeon]